MTIAKRNNYYAFSYEIQGINLVSLLLIQQKWEEKKSSSLGERRRTQQNADACTLWLHISLKLSKECFLTYGLAEESEGITLRRIQGTASGVPTKQITSN